MSVPPDRPTERLQPQPPRPPVVEERYVAPAADPNAILLRLEDAVNSLRTGLMIVGVIAVAALGVAIYALMQDDDGAATRGNAASESRVSQLDDRIDRLSRQVQDVRSDARSNDETAGLGDRVEALEGTVEQLADRPAPGDATQAVQELSERIDDVAADVEQLKTAPPP
jgi:archaellum component FlaC